MSEDKKMIEVSKDKLDSIMSEISVLKDTVSKQRYKEAEERQSKTFALKGHLKRLRGEVIIAWYPMVVMGNPSKTVYDSKGEPIEIREKDSKAKMEIIERDTVAVGETLIGHYKTIKGKDIVCDAREFYRSTSLEKFDKVKDMGQCWEVKFHNKSLPQSYKLNIDFINP